MKSREEYNAYMRAYQKRKRDEMTYEEWRAFRDKTMFTIKKGMITAHQSRLKKTENISDRNKNYIIG
jgi:hypothetical protein